MGPTDDPATVAVTATAALALLLGAALALPASLALLGLYRRAVLRSMGARSRAAGATALEAPPDHPPPGEGDSPVPVADDAATTAEGARRARPLRDPWRAAAVYAVAGMCAATVFATAFLGATDTEILPLRFAALVWAYAWPVVLTVMLVAATTLRARLAVASVYLLAALALGAVGMARDPSSGPGAIVALWLLFNLPPTLLLLGFLIRRIRAVGPLVLAFFLLAVAGGNLALLAVQRDERLFEIVFEVGWALGLGASGVVIGTVAMGFALFGVAGWLMLIAIRVLYERKKVSDQSITLDAIWLTFAIVYSITLVFEGLQWALVALAAFGVYRAVAQSGFWLLHRLAPRAEPASQLLLLRVFSLGRRSERLFDAVAKHWRYLGGVRLIAGPDLATTTIEPHEFLDFLQGTLARRFINGPRTLAKRISETDLEPDHDGRFRVQDFFCNEDAWKMVLSRLVGDSDAVLMDLRGFSPRNAGCVFEINELINLVSLRRVVFVVDDTTDERFLSEVVHAAWASMPAGSPNRVVHPAELEVFRLSASRGRDVEHLIRTISLAAAGLAPVRDRSVTAT